MGNDEQIRRLTRRAEDAETRVAQLETELQTAMKLYSEAVRHIEAIYTIIRIDILDPPGPRKEGRVNPHES